MSKACSQRSLRQAKDFRQTLAEECHHLLQALTSGPGLQREGNGQITSKNAHTLNANSECLLAIANIKTQGTATLEIVKQHKQKWHTTRVYHCMSQCIHVHLKLSSQYGRKQLHYCVSRWFCMKI